MFVGKTVSFIPSLLTDLFSKPIDFEVGEIVYRKYEKPKESSSNTACDTDTSDAFGFWYCDLIENNSSHMLEVQETMGICFMNLFLHYACSIFSMSNLSFSERLS
jgi:hypothetical protein